MNIPLYSARFFDLFLWLLIFFCFSHSVFAQSNPNTHSSTHANTHPNTQALYAELKPKIVQIKILSKKTGEKSSIGSGFILASGDVIATNYHVISEIATRPNEFYGQYRTTADELGDFDLVSFDVINDLAILRADKVLATPLTLAPLPAKGAAIFSLGNPHDLGFVIVNGVNNGIIPKSDPPRVFFSASINSGMSGGPSVNENGQVVAVNVAVKRRSGDISFLVPAKYLHALVQRAESQNFTLPDDPEEAWATLIDEQLLAESAYYFKTLESHSRDYVNLGELRVPSKVGNSFKCWDLSDDAKAKEWLVEKSGVTCYHSRQHYVSRQERQGYVDIHFKHLKAKEPIGRRQFYHYVEKEQSLRDFRYFGDKSTNEMPANCSSEFVEIARHEFKVHICAQADKKRAGIADVEVLATSVDRKNEAWIIRLSVTGSTIKEVLGLTQSIFEDITLIAQQDEDKSEAN